MSKFFRALCCCSSTGVTSPVVANQVHSTGSRNTNTNRNNRQQNVSSANSERRRQHQSSRPEKKPEKKFLKLKSSHKTQDIRYSEFQSQDDKDLKFNCPICFRFFNRILVGSCCYNYLCHFCAEDVNERVRKDEKVLAARCPFCDTDEFVLYDVDIKEKPKKYTDSFYSTIKSATKGNFKSKLFMNNNEEELQGSNIDGPSPNPEVSLKDKRSTSDGMIYLQKEMLKAKANRTVGNYPDADADADGDKEFNFNQTDNVLANQSPLRLEHSSVSQNSPVRENIAEVRDEADDAASDDSLNQRDPLPIDVIKEQECESSILPDTALQEAH